MYVNVSSRYIELGAGRDKIVKWWQRTQSRKAEIDPLAHPSLWLQSSKLPRKYMDGWDPNRKRLRKNQRDAKKKKQQGQLAL